jgi:glycosyltransferase involved in cell wall biosynthesis
MNILLLDQFSDLGGGQRCLLDLVPAFQERGWRVTAALPGNGELVRRLGALDVPVVAIPCGPYHSGRKTGTDIARFVRDAILTARRLPAADLVYVNGPRILPSVAIAALPCPVIFHAHSCLDKVYAIQLARWSLSLTRATVISSSHAAAVSVARPGLRIVDNGVSDCLGSRPVRGGPPRIGVVGRIAPEKGQLEFVRAARLLTGRGLSGQYIICGAPLLTSPEYAARVEKEARGLPVDFAGWNDDIPAVLAGLDLLIVPSAGMEAAPRVIPEAFSARVPVIASEIGGIPEMVEHGVTGFLVPPRSPQALATAIEDALSKDLQSIRTNARACWERRFTLARYRESICSVVGDCLLSSSKPKAAAAARAITAPTLNGRE